MANDKQIQLDDEKTICFLVGYITKKAIKVDINIEQYIKDKILNNLALFDYDAIKKIYVHSIKTLSTGAVDGASDDADIDAVINYTSTLLLKYDNAVDLDKTKISYYYTLGLTANDITISDGKIIYKQ